jgi:hypothetical protein
VVEDRDRGVSTGQRLLPDFNVSGAAHPLSGNAQRILINGDYILIRKNRSHIRTHVADVISGR